MNGDALPEITEVQRLSLRPGDTLIITVNVFVLSDADAARVADRVRAIVGDRTLPVIVLPAGATASILGGDQ